VNEIHVLLQHKLPTKILSNSIGGAMLKQIIDWFTKPQITEIEHYISSHNPKNTADVEQLINEFNYKRKLQCF
jgi:hypothetical protein